MAGFNFPSQPFLIEGPSKPGMRRTLCFIPFSGPSHTALRSQRVPKMGSSALPGSRVSVLAELAGWPSGSPDSPQRAVADYSFKQTPVKKKNLSLD